MPTDYESTVDPNNPETADTVYRRPMPPGDVKQMGDYESPMDYVVERVPVYSWRGQEFIGPLEMAPSWPQDLQPVRWVDVPTTPERQM